MKLYVAVNLEESPIYFNREFNPNDFIIFTSLSELFEFAFEREFQKPDEYIPYVYYDLLYGKHISHHEEIYREYLGDNWYQEIGEMRDERRNL